MSRKEYTGEKRKHNDCYINAGCVYKQLNSQNIKVLKILRHTMIFYAEDV